MGDKEVVQRWLMGQHGYALVGLMDSPSDFCVYPILLNQHNTPLRYFHDLQPSSRLRLDGPSAFTFENTVHRITDGTFHRSHIFSQAMELHAHPSLLGPGFREPNPLTWFRPSRASIPFEGMGRGLDHSEHEAPHADTPCR